MAFIAGSAVPRRLPAVASSTTLPRPHAVVLYFAIPIAIAMVMAWNPTGQRAPLMPGYSWAALYWCGILMPLWVLMHGCTRMLQFCCERLGHRPHLLVLLVSGAIVSILPMRVYLIFYWEFIDTLLDPARALRFADLPPMLPESIHQFLLTLQRAGVLLGVWVAVNYFYARLLYLPRYGYQFLAAEAAMPFRRQEVPANRQPVAAAAEPQVPAAISERMSRHLGSEIIALQAQDHYVRVVTPLGAELILYRFSDAIRELPPECGIRVHRSFWVARSAVQRLLCRAGRHYLLLSNGERVPISRTYLSEVRRLLDQN